ncbi:ABC transporter ATP-binding protein [Actinoplanes sp. KI2]|uniref:ABC transporter ATP-binding protein n=1 Tax=Actinoplanes sp. KI2 TaxID=2983315 RepID=UPI0021D588C3|nr:ABC transporter ATP-binding protein [Actinoplanes sp. KI2]MCU7723739.1 ABC transporter ATP-binding protein [Actinoplanes sp. KI2]
MMPVLTARGAGVRHRRRWLFRDLDLHVEPGDLVAVVGPPGSGRTTLLLALARRFRLSAGKITIDGGSALGHVPAVTAPEPVFTVAEHVRERLALLGRKKGEPVDLLGLDPELKGRDLTPYEKQVLGLVLALLSGPALIALDGLDDGLEAGEREALLKQLAEIAAEGTAVVFTARDIDPASVTTVIRLVGRHAGDGEAAMPAVTASASAADTAVLQVSADTAVLQISVADTAVLTFPEMSDVEGSDVDAADTEGER